MIALIELFAGLVFVLFATVLGIAVLDWPPLPEVLALLPERFQYTVHNIIGHPLMEVLHQLGFEATAERVHGATMPTGMAHEA